MKLQAKAKKWLIGLGAGCLSVTMCATGCVLGLRNNANAITNNDTTSYVKVGEIWNGSGFNKENFTKLVQYVSGNTHAAPKILSNLKNTTKTSAQMKANAVGDKTADKDIIVTFGGLDWEVVYLSPDKSSNPTLTLWLSNNKQTAFSGRSQTEGLYHGYYNGALYSDWSADWQSSTTPDGTAAFYPTAMYGTSYMRSVTLNNGGQYATSNTALAANPGQSSSSAFAKFTMSSVTGSVTQFLTKPRQMSWQENQSAKTIQNSSNNYPNDAWSKSTADDGFYSAAYNYAEHDGSDAWADDYLWLPSYAETGRNATYLGLWQPSTEQRANYDGSTTSISASVGSNNVNNATSLSGYSWLRSGHNTYATYACSLNPPGSSSSGYNVNGSKAVRPALHLNLKKAAETITYTWHDFADTTWEGTGTESNPYKISSAEELAGLSYMVLQGNKYGGTYFKQTADISLGGYNWYPIGPSVAQCFSGNFDGDNHQISGMFIDATTSVQGLFGHVYASTIKNINLTSAKITTSGFQAGGIVAVADVNYDYEHWYTEIDNCHVNAIIKGQARQLGGICGYGWRPLIKNCSFTGSIEGEDFESDAYSVGGIVGEQYGSYGVTNCWNSGSIKGKDKVGGIVGWLNTATDGVVDCVNTGSVYATRDWAGGIVGYGNSSKIIGCQNYGNVKVDDLDAGGIAGQVSLSEVSDCISNATIETLSFVGSIVGQCTGSSISNCLASGFLITGTYYNHHDGALVGRFAAESTGETSSLENCCFVGDVNKEIDPFYDKRSDTPGTVTSCYVYMNREGYYSSGDFSGWSLVPSLNNNYPVPKVLYHVAQFGDSVNSAWFAGKGFSKS